MLPATPNFNDSANSSPTMLPTLQTEEQRYPASTSYRLVWEEWMEGKRKKFADGKIRPTTMQVYNAMKPYVDWIGDRQITPPLLEEMVAHFKAMGKSNSTVYDDLKVVYGYGIKRGYFLNNPFKVNRLKPTTKRQWKPVTHDVWLRGCTALAGTKTYILWVMCYETAMSSVDVCKLRWDMVDMKTGIISGVRYKMTNRGDGGKFATQLDPGGKGWEQIVKARKHLNEVWDKLDERERTYVWPKLESAYRHMVGRCRGDLITAGFPEKDICTLHDLRRTRITAMVNSGIPIAVCMQVSGHSSPEQLYQYVGVDPSVIGSAVVESVQFSRVCKNQSPSSSEPIALQTSFSSASRPPASSSENPPPSSSPTTTPSEQGRLRQFLIARAARLSAQGAAAVTVRETGRLSSMEQFGDDQPEPMSSSSSASDSSPSGKDSKPPF